MASPAGDPKDIVATGYDAVALRYARLEGDEEWPRMRWLADLLARLAEGSDVLDLGCGDGVPAVREIAARHRATGVDVSGGQIELARRNVPGTCFLCADAASVDFEPRSFDAVVSFYAIDHIPREEHAGLFRRVRRWLRPGGFFLLSVEASDEPGLTGEWLGAPMYFSHYDAPTTLGLLRDAGFTVLGEEIETQVEQGSRIPYLWVLTRNPDL